MRHLHDRPLSGRLLYTAFLLLIGIGYPMALAYLYLSHRGTTASPDSRWRTSWTTTTATAAAHASKRQLYPTAGSASCRGMAARRG